MPADALVEGARPQGACSTKKRCARRASACCRSCRADARKLIGECRSYGERIFVLFELVVGARPPAAVPHAGRREVAAGVRHRISGRGLAARAPQRRDPRFVDRFELFVEQREVANAFSELNDPEDQAARFRAQLENRARGDEEAMDFDADYIRALLHGMPPAAGSASASIGW